MSTSYTTSNADMVIYDELAQTAYLERIQDVIDVFNEKAAGALVLRSEVLEGDYNKRAFYKVGGAIAHRDVDSEATLNGSKISSDEMVGVKIPWKYGPYKSTEEAFKRRARNPEEFSEIVGIDMADAVIEGWLEYGIAAITGAIGCNSDMLAYGTFSTYGKKVLTRGLRTLGDRFNRVAIWVMDADAYFDLIDQAITDKIYEEAGMVVYGGSPGTLGKPVLVTDKASSDTILGLQGGALTVIESQPPSTRAYWINDQENLALGFRGEGAFNVEVLGYSWDTDPGGSNPESTDLSTADNWDKYATDDKATAGVLIDISSDS